MVHMGTLYNDLIDRIVLECKTITEAELKIKFSEGDGIFERTKRDVLQMYPEDVKYNSRTKIYTVIKPELEKPTIEVQCDWESKL